MRCAARHARAQCPRCAVGRVQRQRIAMRPSLHRQPRRLIIAPLPDNSAVDLVKNNMLLRDKSLSRKAKKA